MLVLWGLSGFSVLTLELVWMREMALWCGNTVTAATLVTSTFFACAAAGNLLGARLLRSGIAPLRLYAGFEMLAALAALLCLWVARGLWPHLPALPQGDGLRVLLAVVLAGPASLAAGVAFPCLAEAFVPGPEERATAGAPFYALNLFGATVGVIAGGMWLPWECGIGGTFWIAALVQLAAGGLAWRTAGPLRGVASPERPVGKSPPLGWVLLLGSGLLALAAQALLLLWVRQVLEGSLYAMSAVLAAFIGGLGLGALAAGRLRRRGLAVKTLLRGFSAAGALALFFVPKFGIALSLDPPVLEADSPAGFGLQIVLRCAVWLLPVAFSLGGVFPLAWELLGAPFQSEGRTLGWALALNKLGAAAGGALALFLLLPRAGLAGGTHAIAWGYALVALASGRLGRAWPLALGVLIAGLWQTLSPLPPPGVTPDLRLIDSQCGPNGPVSVVEREGSRQILLNSRQTLSGTGRALDSQHHQSWAPLLLHPHPRTVCTIGMAAGISAAAALDFPIAQLDAIELVPEVVGAAREHFRPWNERLFADPRARVVVDDGRQVLTRSTATYDAILCDLFFPAEEGTAHLYSREFFELARARLNDTGVFCIWLPCYQLSSSTADGIIRTFLDVFPNALLVRSSLDPLQPVAGLIGSATPFAVSAAELDQRIESAGLKDRSPFLRSGRHAQMLLLGDLRAAHPGFDALPPITDDQPRFAWLGPVVNPAREGLYGVRFLNWAGKRFPEARFPSCRLPAGEAEDLHAALRAANHYLATAVAATLLPDDPRPPAVREEQVRQALRRARAISPERALELEDLGR